MGAWGIDELRWTKPVYPGDVLKTKIEVLETKKSAKKLHKNRIIKSLYFDNLNLKIPHHQNINIIFDFLIL